MSVAKKQREVVESDGTIIWKGVPLMYVSRERVRLQGESAKQWKARVDRARTITREAMAAKRAAGKNNPPKYFAPGTRQVTGDRIVLSESSDEPQDEAHLDPRGPSQGGGSSSLPASEEGSVSAQDGAVSGSPLGAVSGGAVSSTPGSVGGSRASQVLVPAPDFAGASVHSPVSSARVHSGEAFTGGKSSVVVSERERSNSASFTEKFTGGEVGLDIASGASGGHSAHHTTPPPLKGGEGCDVMARCPRPPAAESQVPSSDHGPRPETGDGDLALPGVEVYAQVNALRHALQDQHRRVEELLVETAKLSSHIAWARANFPEFLHRLGVVEQELGGVQPPRKPWLPPVPEAIQDREVAAQRLRESLDPSLRKMADYEEGRWPYCGWHLAVAHIRNKGVPLTLSLEPRDKMALDHVQVVAEQMAMDDPTMGADLLFYWFKRFLSMSTDSLEGNSLVDKFLRSVLRGEVSHRVPEGISPHWPTTSEQVAEYQPVWPVKEVEFQWAMERDAYYADRAKRAAAAEEESKRKLEEAKQARLAREQELRQEYQREKAEFEAANAASMNRGGSWGET